MAQGKKTGGKDWEPGQSGNPNGRPASGETISGFWKEMLEEIESVRDNDTKKIYKIKSKKLFARRILRLALEGNIHAAKLIISYTEGSPYQPLTFPDGLPDINVTYTPEERKRMAKEFGILLNKKIK